MRPVTISILSTAIPVLLGACEKEVVLRHEPSGRVAVSAAAIEPIEFRFGECYLVSVLAGQAHRVEDLSVALQLLWRRTGVAECSLGTGAECDAVLLLNRMIDIRAIRATEGHLKRVSAKGEGHATLTASIRFLDEDDEWTLVLREVAILSAPELVAEEMLSGIAFRSPHVVESWRRTCNVREDLSLRELPPAS